MHRILFLFAMSALVSTPIYSAESDPSHSPVPAPPVREGLTHNPALHDAATGDSRNNHEEDSLDDHHGQETIHSMAEGHARMGPHFRWTTLRPANQADQQRAAEIVATLRNALEPYRDYRQAIKDGYRPFLPNVGQPHYHFTSAWRGLKSALRFQADQPTALLYKKVDNGYELEGAMYTVPKRADENDLDKRIPLSVAQWHAHVNMCLPPKPEAKTADWKKFGPNGSILTEGECKAVNGRWVPQLFGWMIHVYPFKQSPEEIWTQ